MLFVGMLFLLIHWPSAWGFSHIKLAPEFERSLRESSSPMMGTKALSKSSTQAALPVDGQVSPIYQTVEEYLETEYQNIAERQILDLTIINGELYLGLNNFLGYSWQKSFGSFSVNADRQVTQNLFSDNWIVQDTFTFRIEATKLLDDMKNDGLLNMNDTEIGAFAGLSFHRTYTYYHYAPSYEDGLRADFKKLFFPYRFFYEQRITDLDHEEIVRRQDSWKVRAGGLIKTPPLSNVSFSAGILTTLAFEKLVSLQKVIDSKIKYQINHKSEKKVELGATLSFQLDFFELLSLTLLRYDLNYEYEKSQAFTLAFNQNQLDQFDTSKRRELASLIRGRDSITYLTPFIHRLDESSSSSLSQTGSILLWGGMKKSKTEQVKVIKDEIIHDFYKHYSQSVTLVQNFWSRLFSAVVYKIFKIPVASSTESLLSKQITLEMKATHPQSHDLNVQRIADLKDFSFVIKKSYQANRTHRWYDGTKRNQAIYFVDHFTSLPKDYKTFLRKNELRGPLTLDTQLRVEEAGLHYLLTQAESNIFYSIAKICHSDMIYKWMDDAHRRSLLKKSQYGNEACVKRIGNKFLNFKQDFQVHNYAASTKLFREFIQDFYKESTKLEEMVLLFGSDNSFIHGSFNATTNKGHAFMTTFSAGQFRGLGVIDNFQRSTGSRQPASIISE
ncbi:MAG TPA: hypothetical protein VKY27_01715 [Bacteriovoracaceae bacterium]|nr:hypothetical protein [Bacteriovoracaceae bacterium]